MHKDNTKGKRKSNKQEKWKNVTGEENRANKETNTQANDTNKLYQQNRGKQSQAQTQTRNKQNR